MKSRSVLVTTTFSPSLSDVRAQLAIKTCIAARDDGYKIIVVDGSPSSEFKSALRDTGAIVLDEKIRGMGASRRQAINAGLETGVEVIVWLEPEKYPIVPLLLPCIAKLLLKQRVNFDGVIVPRRRNLDGYPQYQHFSELRANWELGDITRRHDLDLFVGPRVMTRAAAELMASYSGLVDGKQVYEDKWEILFIPMLWMLLHRERFFVDSALIDYVHPVEQLIEDDEAMRGKRDIQRINLVAAMAAEAKRIGL